MFVADPDTGKSVTIQTKTMTEAFVRSRKWGPYWKWQVGTKAGRGPVREAFYYAFVDLKGGQMQTPDVFIVPSAEVRELSGAFPERTDLESPDVKAVWCNTREEDAPKYQNRCTGVAVQRPKPVDTPR